MNVGANMAVGNKLLFMDADIFFGCNYLQKIYDYKKPWFVAWSKLIYLDMVNTNVLLTDKKPSTVENYDKDAMWSDPLCAAGGSVCVDREWFYNLFGGNNENYFGWGAEDNDSACRAMTIMKEFCRLRYSIYHLHHDDDRVDNCGKCSSKNNQHQWWITQHHSSEITKRIIHTKIGQTTGPTLVKIRDLRP